MDLGRAERCVHARREVAFAAADAAGLPGSFLTSSLGGLLVSLTNVPGLEFLNQVSGLTAGSLGALPEVLAMFEAMAAPSPSVVDGSGQPAVREALMQMGWDRSGPRPMAAAPCAEVPVPRTSAVAHEVTEAVTAEDVGVFLRVLLGGYAASPALEGFLRAEHLAPGVRHFIAWSGDRPVAAAAMSIHGETALLGGAATLPAARGRGAQAALLRHRLTEASLAGAITAVATAAPDSVSVRNLVRAGFTVTPRHSWVPGIWPLRCG